MNCDFCKKALPSRKEVSTCMCTLTMCVTERHQMPVVDPGGGHKGGNGTPLSEKRNMHAYFLTINNPALAILLSSSRLEDIRGLHSGACDSSNNAHQKSQPHSLAARTHCCINKVQSATGMGTYTTKICPRCFKIH